MPTQIRWCPPIPLSAAEEAVTQKLRRTGKFYLFLREVRAELFDDAFQTELAAAYQPRGTAPLPAALLAMVTLLQAYDQVGDAEAVETAQVDLRWQLVLGCLGCTRAPFSQGALVKFRERMIAHDLDRKLLDRTVALAKQTGRFGWQHLRAALDSSPLVGAGRVQDTWNLLGRALGTVATWAAKAVGRPRTEVLREAQVTLLAAPSLKAALDIDWDDPTAQTGALARLLAEVDQLEQWVARHVPDVRQTAPLQAALTALRRVLAQDLEPDPVTQVRRIRRGVAADRMPSLGDPEMRHGRKTRTRPFNGYKRHVLKLLGPNVIVGALVRPANEAEHLTLAPLLPTVTALGALDELFIDRWAASTTFAGRIASPGLLPGGDRCLRIGATVVTKEARCQRSVQRRGANWSSRSAPGIVAPVWTTSAGCWTSLSRSPGTTASMPSACSIRSLPEFPGGTVDGIRCTTKPSGRR